MNVLTSRIIQVMPELENGIMHGLSADTYASNYEAGYQFFLKKIKRKVCAGEGDEEIEKRVRLEWSELFDEEQECYATLAQFEESRLQNKTAQNEGNGKEAEPNIVTGLSSPESPIAQTSVKGIDAKTAQSEIRDGGNGKEVVSSAVTGSSNGSSLPEYLAAQGSDDQNAAQGVDEKSAQSEMTNEENGNEVVSSAVTDSSLPESLVAQGSDNQTAEQGADEKSAKNEKRDEENVKEAVSNIVTGSSLLESLVAQTSDEQRSAQGADEKTAQNEMRDDHLIEGEMALSDLAKTNGAQSKIGDENAGNGESDDNVYNDSETDESEHTENRASPLSKEEREELENSMFDPSMWELPDNWTVKEAKGGGMLFQSPTGQTFDQHEQAQDYCSTQLEKKTGTRHRGESNKKNKTVSELYPLGTNVIKPAEYFPFRGKVISIHARSTKKRYHILYNDGDEERLSAMEVKSRKVDRQAKGIDVGTEIEKLFPIAYEGKVVGVPSEESALYSVCLAANGKVENISSELLATWVKHNEEKSTMPFLATICEDPDNICPYCKKQFKSEKFLMNHMENINCIKNSSIIHTPSPEENSCNGSDGESVHIASDALSALKTSSKHGNDDKEKHVDGTENTDDLGNQSDASMTSFDPKKYEIDGKYVCPKCTKDLSCLAGIKYHIKNKVCENKLQKKDQFTCPSCSKAFGYNANLLYHIEQNVCNKEATANAKPKPSQISRITPVKRKSGGNAFETKKVIAKKHRTFETLWDTDDAPATLV
mmetsp:Transcript_21821/g.32359  ORF Transcript_21821/g.32359 Transcript_21821/m.32359 type:complete len:766 (+) Transcript_21821:98-2395(+)